MPKSAKITGMKNSNTMHKEVAQMAQTNALALAPNTALRALGPVQSLDAYIRMANEVPMLTQAEELDLATRLFHQNDIEAAQRLIMSHLRFVIKIARGFSGYGLALADLIQEGNIGLMKAVKRFNPEIGVRLVTFAVHWIKAEIHDFVIKNWRIVKVATTKAQRKLFFNLRSAKKRLGWFSQDEIQSVAESLNVKPSEVIEMEKRMNAYDAAFDAPEQDSEEGQFSPVNYLSADEQFNPEDSVVNENFDSHANNQLTDALENLDPRSRDIINTRWLAENKATLHDLAAKYDISAERVRQLENAAMKKLKARLGDVALG